MRWSRPSRAEVLKRYRACYRQLGRAPGWEMFRQMAGLHSIDILNYWPRINDLAREAGVTPNKFTLPSTEEELFREYARVCLHLRKIPNSKELGVTNRKLGTHVTGAFTRYGGIAEFDRRFLNWLVQGEEKFKPIISLPGWQRKGQIKTPEPEPSLAEAYPFPFLPVALQDLEKLARDEDTQRNPESSQALFRERCSEAFRALGFAISEVEPWAGLPPSAVLHSSTVAADLGAVLGVIPRLPDAVVLGPRCLAASAPACGYTVLLDPQARREKYEPPIRSRDFLERVAWYVRRLEQDGHKRVYLALLGPSFRESDLVALVPYLQGAGLGGMTLLAVTALMRIVSESIRERAGFTLTNFEKTLAGNSLLRS